MKRVDYEPVGLVSAAPGGARWYHQHFNTSAEPFRLTAWFGPNHPSLVTGLPPGEKQIDYTAMDVTEGGTSIPYWMEDPHLQARVRGDDRAVRRAEPHGPRPLRGAGAGMSGPARILAEEADPGGRIHFSAAGRSLIEEDEIELTSVGVDIGSSTSHLMVSTIVLERLDTRYVVAERRVAHESRILLTPYAAEKPDRRRRRWGASSPASMRAAGLDPGDIDTGALILTGVAARRPNARAIGELFAAEAGKFVARQCRRRARSADGGARLGRGGALGAGRAGSGHRRGRRDDEACALRTGRGGGAHRARRRGAAGGLRRGGADRQARAFRRGVAGTRGHRGGRGRRAGQRGAGPRGRGDGRGDPRLRRSGRMLRASCACHRSPPATPPERIVVSGGVSEYLQGCAGVGDDLGAELAQALRARLDGWGPALVPPRAGIRATVVGASQYTVQVSGSTIFLDPPDALPVRNVPVIAPALALGETVAPAEVAAAVTDALARMELASGERPVAVALPWRGTASYGRLSALARGLVQGLAPVLAAGHPLIVVTDGDVGGLLGMQCRAEEDVPGAIVSIDGIALSEFDFIDIGAVIRSTGAAPVVIKSLLFPEA